jgi:hypothetical protein
MCELLSLGDHTQQFRSDGKTHRVGFIDRHPRHGSYGYTNFTRTAGPFCRVYRDPDLSGGYWVTYPSELVLADETATVSKL